MPRDFDQLPAIIEPSVAQPPPLQPGLAIPEPEPTTVPLAHYWWMIRRQSWKIAAFVIASLIVTFVVSLRLQPIYEATAAVNIDREAPTALIGDQAEKSSGGPIDADQYIATQIKIIQSDSVLRPVAGRFN